MGSLVDGSYFPSTISFDPPNASGKAVEPILVSVT
jgi:hypothetical protein